MNSVTKNTKQTNDKNESSYAFFRRSNGAVRVNKMIPADMAPEMFTGCWRLDFNQEDEVYEFVPMDVIANPEKLYGNVLENVSRYFKCFDRVNHNVGVALIGEKGSGKTTTVRAITKTALGMDMPVINISRNFGAALAPILATIKSPCVVIFDEFDKNFSDDELTNEFQPQDALLPLFDGSTGGGKKLLVISGNKSEKISEYFKNRPSRIRFTESFTVLPQDLMLGYLKDNLKCQDNGEIYNFIHLRHGLGTMNFDMMVAIVEEMNLDPSLTPFQACNMLFGDSKFSRRVSYVAEVTTEDGYTFKTFADKTVSTVSGLTIRLDLRSVSLKESVENMTLNSTNYVESNELYTEHIYRKDGLTLKMMYASTEMEFQRSDLNDVDPSVRDDTIDYVRSNHARVAELRKKIDEKGKQLTQDDVVNVYPLPAGVGK